MLPASLTGGNTVLNRYLLTGALAAACSGALLTAQAQQPQPPSPAQPQTPTTTQRPSSETAAQKAVTTTTVVGCVYRERDIPGRAPNVAERAGIGEDYILAEVSGQASAGAGATAGATGTAGSQAGSKPSATGTSGTTGPMYKLEDVDDDKLKVMIGKRVEVTGRVDPESAAAPSSPGATTSTTDKVVGRDRVNIAEFEVTTIKEVSGACPTTPGAGGTGR
jgi:hypothetical protein